MAGNNAVAANNATNHDPVITRGTDAAEIPIQERIVAAMFVERGKRDKYGRLAAFDELAEYLGRPS